MAVVEAETGVLLLAFWVSTMRAKVVRSLGELSGDVLITCSKWAFSERKKKKKTKKSDVDSQRMKKTNKQTNKHKTNTKKTPKKTNKKQQKQKKTLKRLE